MNRFMGIFLVLALLLGGCTTTGTGGGPKSPTESAEEQDQHPLKRWMSKQSRAKKKGILGAAIGAATGAATAALTGRNPWQGAAVGAIAGGVTGFLVGRQQDKLYGSRDEAVRKLDYDTSQGYVMEVEGISFTPANPQPGDEVEMTVRYLVVGPDPNETLVVSSRTGVEYDGEYVMWHGPGEFTIERGGGMVESTITMTLPEDAPSGTYGLQALVEDSRGRFEDSSQETMYLG